MGDLFNIKADLRRRGRCVGKNLISEALACPRRSDSIGQGKTDEEKKRENETVKHRLEQEKGQLDLFLYIYFNIFLFIYLLMVFVD